MAARGNIAKDYVERVIREAFGKNFIGLQDKKIYVQAEENGEMVQIAISMTCPKNPVQITNSTATGDFNFEDDAAPVSPTVAPASAKITEEERARVEELMKALNL